MIDVDRSTVEDMAVVETETPCVLDFQHISIFQKSDRNIQQNLATKTYKMETFEKETIATLNGKVVIPTLLLNDMIAWYHENLQHPGITRTYKTISSHFYYTNLEKYVGLFIKKCFICIKTKFYLY